MNGYIDFEQRKKNVDDIVKWLELYCNDRHRTRIATDIMSGSESGKMVLNLIYKTKELLFRPTTVRILIRYLWMFAEEYMALKGLSSLKKAHEEINSDFDSFFSLYASNLNIDLVGAANDRKIDKHELFYSKIDKLNLPAKTMNTLKKLGIVRVYTLMSRTGTFIAKCKDLKMEDLTAIKKALGENGLALGMRSETLELTALPPHFTNEDCFIKTSIESLMENNEILTEEQVLSFKRKVWENIFHIGKFDTLTSQPRANKSFSFMLLLDSITDILSGNSNVSNKTKAYRKLATLACIDLAVSKPEEFHTRYKSLVSRFCAGKLHGSHKTGPKKAKANKNVEASLV